MLTLKMMITDLNYATENDRTFEYRTRSFIIERILYASVSYMQETDNLLKASFNIDQKYSLKCTYP